MPTQPAPIVVVSAASAMHDFNFSNPAAVFMNATSNLLNKSIFLNSAAALPLTLFIGTFYCCSCSFVLCGHSASE